MAVCRVLCFLPLLTMSSCVMMMCDHGRGRGGMSTWLVVGGDHLPLCFFIVLLLVKNNTIFVIWFLSRRRSSKKENDLRTYTPFFCAYDDHTGRRGQLLASPRSRSGRILRAVACSWSRRGGAGGGRSTHSFDVTGRPNGNPRGSQALSSVAFQERFAKVDTCKLGFTAQGNNGKGWPFPL